MAYKDVDTAELELRGERLEKLRSSGVLTQTIDGNTTTFRTMAELNQEIRRIRRELQYRAGITPPHPYARPTF